MPYYSPTLLPYYLSRDLPVRHGGGQKVLGSTHHFFLLGVPGVRSGGGVVDACEPRQLHVQGVVPRAHSALNLELEGEGSSGKEGCSQGRGKGKGGKGRRRKH